MKDEKGQALAELLIAVPMLAVLLWVLLQTALIFQERLELVALTREFAIGLSRDGGVHRDKSAIERDLRVLAAHTRLDPRRLSMTLTPLGVGAAGKDLTGLLASMALGDRLTLSYRHLFQGMPGWALSHGLSLEESVAFKAGPWKTPDIKNFFQSH
ncbi:MAG: hypothetical protein V4498_06720 [candidate division FCPU426 bacterium]